MSDFLKIGDIAKRLDVSYPAVWRFVRLGILPAVNVARPGARAAWRVPVKDFDHWIASRTRRASGHAPDAEVKR